MKSVIPFRKVLSRKFDVGNVYGNGGYVLNYGALTANPTHTNVKLFVEFGVSDSPDIKFNQTLDLVNLLKEEDRDGLTDTILNLMDGIVNLENAIEKISSSKFDSDSKNELIERCNVLEACDRVLRNRAKIQKRFNFDKVIRENKYGDLKHTVNELCALIDTYDISSKAKLNIAIENINYSFLASGNEQNVNEVTDYIVGYFLSRSPIITDKDANGYIDVLENNLFIDKDSIPAYHTMIYNRDNEFGCTFVNAINNIAVQCESAEMTSLIESMPRITTEKTASGFMDRFKKLCQEETIPDSDIMNGIKAFCTLPLIGSINSEFICYQLDKQIDLEIKDRIKDYEGDITVSTVIKNGDLVTMSEFVSSPINEIKVLNGRYNVNPKLFTKLVSPAFKPSNLLLALKGEKYNFDLIKKHLIELVDLCETSDDLGWLRTELSVGSIETTIKNIEKVENGDTRRLSKSFVNDVQNGKLNKQEVIEYNNWLKKDLKEIINKKAKEIRQKEKLVQEVSISGYDLSPGLAAKFIGKSISPFTALAGMKARMGDYHSVKWNFMTLIRSCKTKEDLEFMHHNISEVLKDHKRLIPFVKKIANGEKIPDDGFSAVYYQQYKGVTKDTLDRTIEDIEGYIKWLEEQKAGLEKLMKNIKESVEEDENEEQIDLLEALLDNDNFKKDIESFKTSQKKTPSAFKALINKALTKSPEALLDEAPDLLALGRGMIYICIAALLPYGPVIAGISMLIMKLIGMKLNINKAKQLMRHLKKEKEATVKKKDKLKSDKEKKATEEYIACLDKGIKKLADYILDIDDEDDEASDASIGSLSKDDDEFDFGDDNDDFDFGDFSFEEAVSFTGRLLEAVIDIEESSSVFIPNIPSYLVGESLSECSGLFSNCPKELRDQFYSTIDSQLKQSKDPITNTICTSLLDSKDRDILEANTYAKIFLQRDAMKEAISVVNEAFDLNTLKLAFVNFKNKAKQLKSKEQAIWRNIDIAASGLSKGFQRALTSDRREAIIKGSIIPSFSKIIKSALAVGAVGAFTGPVGAAITALGGFAVSKSLNHKERMLIYDEIDTELQVVEKQLQLAESEGDMNQYRFLLNYQKKLQREKQRIKYGIKMQGRDLPEIKGGDK